jgi:hypothetical protein
LKPGEHFGATVLKRRNKVFRFHGALGYELPATNVRPSRKREPFLGSQDRLVRFGTADFQRLRRLYVGSGEIEIDLLLFLVKD